MITIKANADQSSAVFFRGVVTNYINTLNYDVDQCVENEIRTVLSEAVSNVLVHAYPDSDKKPITVTIDHKEELGKVVLVLTVEDEGVGIQDIKKCMEPMYTTVKDESRAGLGFTIMETMSDSLLVTSNPGSGTRIELTKVLADSLSL